MASDFEVTQKTVYFRSHVNIMVGLEDGPILPHLRLEPGFPHPSEFNAYSV